MKKGTNRGNGVQKSHVPVPEDRRKTERARLCSKEKEQTSTCKSGNGVQKSHVTEPEDRRKTERARLIAKEKEQISTYSKGELEQKEKERSVPVKQASKSFLLEENTKLKEEVHSKIEQIKEMENALKVQSDNMNKLKLEAEDREKVSQDNQEMLANKCELAESKLAEHRNRLLQSNINPVMLAQIDVSAEDKENIFKKQMQAKEEVTSLRENLKSFSCIVSEQLVFLQTKEADLDGIIDCGEET